MEFQESTSLNGGTELKNFVLSLLLLVCFSVNADEANVEKTAEVKKVEIAFSDCTEQIEENLLNSIKSNKTHDQLVYDLKQIDSKTFRLLARLTLLDQAQLFSFLDSLNNDAFKLIFFWNRQVVASDNLGLILKIVFLKNKAFHKLVDEKEMSLIIYNLSPLLVRCDPEMVKYYTNKEFYNKISDEYFATGFDTDYVKDTQHILALVLFYDKTLQKPLPITTDYLKKLFGTLPKDLQTHLIETNLVSS